MEGRRTAEGLPVDIRIKNRYMNFMLNRSRESMHSSTLAIKQGMPAMRLFGCFFFVFSVLVVIATVSGGTFTVNGRPGTPTEKVVFNVLFVALTIVLLGYRRGTFLDTRMRKLTTWHGLFIPIWKKQYSLDNVQQVKLTENLEGTHEQTHREYIAWVSGEDLLVRCYKFTDLKKVRHEAERIARFLHVPLEDSTSGHLVKITPDELGEPLRKRLQRNGQEQLWPVPASDSRLLVRTESGLTAIQLPKRGMQLRPGFYIQCIPLFAMGAWFMKTFYYPIATGAEGAPPIASAGWFFLFGLCNVFLLIFLSPIIIYIKARLKQGESETIICTRDELKIMRRKPVTLATNEIIEFRLDQPEVRARKQRQKSKGLVIETGAEEIRVGDFLNPDELAWLRDALSHLIAHGPLK